MTLSQGVDMWRRRFLPALLVMVLVVAGCTSAQTPTPVPLDLATDHIVVGYFAQWVADRGYFVSDIPATRITHINYAFANVSTGGECILGDPVADIGRSYAAEDSVSGEADSSDPGVLHGNFSQLKDLKAMYPHLKILISIGGWTWSENFSDAALTDASREKFVGSCIDLYLEQYEGVFDGIDVDWEYPVGGGMVAGRPEDKRNFTLLMAEFREQLDDLGAAKGRHYLLTIAAPGGSGLDQKYERSEYIQYLDWVNLMTYDLHGTWESTTNFNAPLYQPSDDQGSASLNVDAVVQDYLDAGIPADKLVLGMPFYGHGWKGVGNVDHGLYQSSTGAAGGKYDPGSFTYNELKDGYISIYDRYWNIEAQVPWLYSPASAIFISYDDPESIAAKAGYASDQGLAGVMIWELSQGDDEMIAAVQDGFQAGGLGHIVPTRDPNAVVIPRPFEADIYAVGDIEVDGALTDWPAEPTFVLDDESQITYTYSPDSWEGPEDLSGEIWVGWTEDGLYFAVEVIDDAHLQRSTGANLWHGDYVELQFDTQLDKDYDRLTMNSDDYQIGVSVGDFDTVLPESYAWFNGADTEGSIGVQQAQTQTTGGYILEIFIPIDLLGGFTLVDGTAFGMNVSLSDADSIVLGQETMLSTSSTRTYDNPTTFGKITLVK
jgi:GH18 family chitinase